MRKKHYHSLTSDLIVGVVNCSLEKAIGLLRASAEARFSAVSPEKRVILFAWARERVQEQR